MRVIVRFFQLSAREQRRVVLASAFLLATHAALRIFGFYRCHSFLARRATQVAGHRETKNCPQELVTAFQRVVNALGIGKCLSRSMALRGFLQHYGIDAQMRIGVSNSGDVLDAHAWLEYRGHVLGERVAPKYRVFPALD